MDASNTRTTRGTIDHTKPLDDYKEMVERLFPTLPRDYVDTQSFSRVDALVLGYFLECYPRKVVVLDRGTLASASALHFASQRQVLRVISIGPNPTLADEIEGELATPGDNIDSEPLRNLRVLDVAQAALAQFGVEQQKIELRVGSVQNGQIDLQGGFLDSLEQAAMAASESSDNLALVAFVAGVDTKEGVRATLEAIFGKAPRAVVILDNCRGSNGPFVQAGVVSFMEGTQEKYHFQLFGDLGPSIATSGLGIVYPDLDAAEAKQTLMKFTELFSERLDLLRLLRREEELINAVNQHKSKADRYKKEAKRLRKRHSRPRAQDSSRQQMTEIPTESAPRASGIRKLARSKLIRRLVLRT